MQIVFLMALRSSRNCSQLGLKFHICFSLDFPSTSGFGLNIYKFIIMTGLAIDTMMMK